LPLGDNSSTKVHEAYLKLVDQKKANWQNRVQFFSAAAKVMRHILVDYARGRKAFKRSEGYCRLSLDEFPKPTNK
jgi:hypothetical protein